ncbi:MAG: hypothetical protein J6Y28_09165 [Acholeplasmatales bacterium]|nr:hypothetical protein [Acholeplasmatales bacterium]
MIILKYKNKKIEKLCNDVNEMQRYFKNDKLLIENLKVLLFHFGSVDTIYDFNAKAFLKGYNLEKIVGTKYYSIRIVPKINKRKDRMIIIIVSDDGKEIEIVDIDSEHRYKFKK